MVLFGSTRSLLILLLLLLDSKKSSVQANPNVESESTSLSTNPSKNAVLDADSQQENSDPEPKVWVLGSFIEKQRLALFQCYLVGRDNKGTTAHQQDCCDAIHRFPVHILERSTVSELCRRALVTLPNMPSFAEEDEGHDRLLPSVRLPSYSFFEVLRETSSSPVQQQLPPVDYEVAQSSSSSWRHMLYDDHLRDARWLDDDFGVNPPKLMSAFTVETATRTSSPVVGDKEPLGSIFHAKLTSQLSESGGMHRELHHFINLELPQQPSNNDLTTTTKSSSSSRWEVDLLVLIHLPSDMFVNVQDAFDFSPDKQDHCCSKLHLSLILVNDTVIIDEELPEFLSPPHAFLVRIKGELILKNNNNATSNPSSSSNTNTVVIDFRTKVHLRYPKPVSESSHSFSRVVLLAPVLVVGTLTTAVDDGRSSDNTNANTSLRYYYHHRLVESQQQKEGRLETPLDHVLLLPAEPLVTWVSAGKEQDYLPAMLVTWSVALLGSLVMWRDLSRIAIWR